MIAKDGRCEEWDLFGNCGSGQHVSGWQSIAGETPQRILAARDVRCMDPRAEADWCPCRGGVDGVIAKGGGCEERDLIGKFGSG